MILSATSTIRIIKVDLPIIAVEKLIFNILGSLSEI